MGTGHRLHYRQAETAAPVAPARGGPAESLKSPAEEFLRKPVALVADVDLDHGADLGQLEGYLSGAVAKRVVDDAPQRLIEPQPIDRYLGSPSRDHD